MHDQIKAFHKHPPLTLICEKKSIVKIMMGNFFANPIVASTVGSKPKD